MIESMAEGLVKEKRGHGTHFCAIPTRMRIVGVGHCGYPDRRFPFFIQI